MFSCRSKAKLVWVLSFVLAPYTHILSQTTHKTEAHRFVANVMPRLMEHGRAHQVAVVQDTPSGITTLALLLVAFCAGALNCICSTVCSIGCDCSGC